MTAGTLTLPGRFNGPPTTANGGYAAGRLAAFVGGAAGAVRVRLSAPPPLDVPLAVRRDGDAAELLDRDRVVARAEPGSLGDDVPARPSVAEAAAAVAARGPRPGHPFPTCFGCGPGRQEGESVAALLGPLPDGPAWAGVWRPTVQLPHADGVVAPEVVWVALDCPSAQPVAPDDGPPHVLGTFTAVLHAPVALDTDHVLVAWELGRDGRKKRSASAVLRADGTLCARAEALWIALS